MHSNSASQATNLKLPGIEYARGLAAVMVVFYHAARHMKLNIGYLPMGGIAQFGHAGVDFFFVLSGFIIFYIHKKDIDQPNRLPYYMQRRFTRIFPLFWAIFIIQLVLNTLFSSHHLPEISFLYQSFFLLPTVTEPYIGVAWSLQQEIIFYIIFSIIISNFKLGFFAIYIWLSLIVANWLSIIPISSNTFTAKIFLDYNIEFYFGMLAAWLTTKKLISNTLLFLVIGSVLFIGTGTSENLSLINGYTSGARLAYGLSSFLMILGFVGVRKIDGYVGITLNTLGTASYSIYLTHLIFIGIIYKVLEFTGLFSQSPDWFTYMILSISGIIGGIYVSKLIEYPLMHFVKSFFFRKRPGNFKIR